MNEELWRVQLGTGEIRMMTLEGLDRAFDEGLIDARVPVLAPGASAWTTLGEAAGLDDCPTEQQAPSLSPVAIAPPSSAATPALESAGPLDLDLPEDLELAPRRRGVLAAGGIGALAVAAAIAFVAARGGGSPTDIDVKATTAVEAPPAAAEALPAPVETASEAKRELSDWQKRMLLDADKAREDKTRAKNQDKAQKVERKTKRAKTSPALLNGGDRFDPLNGAL
ncbi:MAG: hypothetical protein KF894_16405 [Labilithrix sp.]|nr:hypothetical protein [Labilithrix sp.]